MKAKASIKPVLAVLGIALLASLGLGVYLDQPSTAAITPDLVRYKDSIIMVTNAAQNGGGTGFAVRTAKGRLVILTNAHVCLGANEDGKVNLVFDNYYGGDGIKSYRSRVIAYADVGDLCIVLPAAGMPALELAPSNPKIGEEIKGYGHPYLQPLTPTKGEVYAYDITTLIWNLPIEQCKGIGYSVREIGGVFGSFMACMREFYSGVSTAPIYPGNSGSPVLNKEGKVSGVFFASDSRTTSGVFIPVSVVRAFLNNY